MTLHFGAVSKITSKFNEVVSDSLVFAFRSVLYSSVHFKQKALLANLFMTLSRLELCFLRDTQRVSTFKGSVRRQKSVAADIINEHLLAPSIPS